MLRAYDARSKSLIPLHPERPSAWVHASDPSPEEVRALEEDLEVPAELLRHALDEDEIARVVKNDGTFLVVIKCPVSKPSRRMPVRVVSVGIAASAEKIVTVSRVQSDDIQQMLDRVVLDLPEPWRVVPHLESVLSPGGVCVAYTPSITQAMQVRDVLRGRWIDARTIEVLHRGWHVEREIIADGRADEADRRHHHRRRRPPRAEQQQQRSGEGPPHA